MPVKQEFEGTVSRVWSHEAENGGFNGGTLGGELEWHEVVVLRAYCKYIRQIGIALSESYIQQTLANNPSITRALIALFRNHFDPELGVAQIGRQAASLGFRAQIDDALNSVTNPDEDRILRLYVTLIEATLRTNYFQRPSPGASRHPLPASRGEGPPPPAPSPRERGEGPRSG